MALLHDARKSNDHREIMPHPGYPNVLLICNDDAKSSVLEGILSEHTSLRIARNLREFQSELVSESYDCVFCGWRCQRSTWKEILQAVRKHNPDLPVVVFCHGGGEREWNEVLSAGGFELLTAPYWKRTVLNVLEHAMTSPEGTTRPQQANRPPLRRPSTATKPFD